MKKYINKAPGLVLLFIVCSFLTVDNLYSDDLPQFRFDSTNITTRNFDRNSLDNFKADPDFDYVVNKQEGDNSGYQFNWLGKLLNKLLGVSFNKDTAAIWEIFIYILCGSLAIWALLNLIKADKSWLIHRKTKKDVIVHEEVETNINEMDIDELIRQAIDQKQYRKVVRLLYLKSLKELNNKNLIHWSAQKTNSDYLNELTPGSLKESFKTTTLIFEYIWYGDFKIDESLLAKVKISFDQFINEIKNT